VVEQVIDSYSVRDIRLGDIRLRDITLGPWAELLGT
jgi:hypothetical protein